LFASYIFGMEGKLEFAEKVPNNGDADA
jgi:hypothetical protein